MNRIDVQFLILDQLLNRLNFFKIYQVSKYLIECIISLKISMKMLIFSFLSTKFQIYFETLIYIF